LAIWVVAVCPVGKPREEVIQVGIARQEVLVEFTAPRVTRQTDIESGFPGYGSQSGAIRSGRQLSGAA